MRPVVAVDLAARFSAVVALDAGGEVLGQWDSGALSAREMALKLWLTAEKSAQLLDGTLPLVVVEDLPPHVPSSTVTKAVAQLQGRIVQQFDQHRLGDLYFVPPAYWERDMDVFRKPTDEWEARAAELGYKPPDLIQRHFDTHGLSVLSATKRRELDKQRTDYVAAYLIAAWAQRCMAEDRAWDLTIVKQYQN